MQATGIFTHGTIMLSFFWTATVFSAKAFIRLQTHFSYKLVVNQSIWLESDNNKKHALTC